MSVSENDKRWLVVLVATDKIVTPLLRDFVAKEIEKLSVFLKNYLQNNSKSCNLQTLTYEICSSDPNFKGLQFRNINNNKNNNDEKKTKVDYNYSINSLVDLAKLYLPDYLAKFAAFDNSMDLSAALRLMGYDSYPTQVFVSSNPSLDIKFLADDVKDVVRNPGAHYTEGTWTEDYMNQCFEKLEALVRALVLPDDQEKNTLDQLHQWNTNGWDLITGTDLHDLMKIFTLNNDRKLKFLASKFEILMERCSSLEERVSSSEKSVDSLKEQLHMEKIRLDNFMVEVCKKFKEDNLISGAHGQLVAPVVSTLSPSSGTSVVSEDDLSGEASHMNEESGDKTYEGSTSNIVSENSIDSSGENLPENQPHVVRINPDIVLLKRQIGLSFKIEFTEKLPEGMESGVADFHNLSMGVNLVKIDDKTLWGKALPHSSTEGVFKVAVFSQNREKCLGETKVAYIDLIEEALEKAINCRKTMLKFLQAAIPCLNVHSEGGTRDAENHTNGGPSGWEKSSLSVQLLQRFIYAAAKVNAVWFIRLIFDLPAGRIVFDSYKGRPLLPEYVARARGHNEIAEYLEDVTKRYSESERTDEEKCNAINWQEIVSAIEATQESPNSSTEGVFKVTVSSHNPEKCLKERKLAGIDFKEEALKQAISCPKTMLKFIQVAIPCLNVHSEGGTCDAENHTNGGPYGWEKSLLSVQLLQRFIYAAAKVNAVWFIRLIFDLPAGRIVFDSYKGRPLLPEYVARARGHNEIAEYLEDVTKRYSESERTDEEKLNAINWQEIVTAIEATQESPNSSTEGVFKVAVSSNNREKCLEETKVADIELIEETLKQAISCPKTMLKFIQVASLCLNVHSEGDTCEAENHTNGGLYGLETSLLSVQLLQRFIYVAAKVNAVWFIRLIFDLPAGRTVFDSYKGRPLLPEYVARARGHNEIAEYLEDVTKRYSKSEITDKEKLNAINWQEIVTAIEATQESPNSSKEGVFKAAVSSNNREKCLEETKVTDIELIEETLKQAISWPNTMLKFIQVAFPCLNVHAEGGTSNGEIHTNGGPSGWEKPSLSVQLLQRFVYAAAKVNAVWFIRLVFDLPTGRIVFDSYKGRPLLPEYVARARGHNVVAEYLEDVTKRYSGSERTDEEKCNVINWQEIVTAIEATQESPNSFSEIMKTGENTAPSQKVREKERRLNFSDKQLNHFKFAHKKPQIRWQIG